MATQRAPLLNVKPLEMLRNTFSAGSSVSSCSESCRFELWVEGARGKSWHQPFAQQRAQRTRVQPGDPILRDTAGAKNSGGRAQTFMPTDCVDVKAQRFLCLGSHLQRHEFKLLFCHCTIIILRIQTSETLLWESLG